MNDDLREALRLLAALVYGVGPCPRDGYGYANTSGIIRADREARAFLRRFDIEGPTGAEHTNGGATRLQANAAPPQTAG